MDCNWIRNSQPYTCRLWSCQLTWYPLWKFFFMNNFYFFFLLKQISNLESFIFFSFIWFYFLIIIHFNNMVLNCSLLFLLNISIFKNIIFNFFAFRKIINFWRFYINIFLRSIFKFIWFLITIWKIFEWSDLRLKIRNFNQRLLVQIIVLIKLVCFLTLRRFNFCTIILFCWKTLKTISI